MTLQGTLDCVDLAEVLRLLAATGKTGCLEVAADGARGSVWVRDGAVVTASCDRTPDAPVDEVVADLLRYRQGSFAFAADERVPGTGPADDVHGLLERAIALVDERRRLEEIIPSLDHEVGIVDRLVDHHEVTVTAQQWSVLVAMAGGCTVGDLTTKLGLTELSALRTVHDLVTSGLTTVRGAHTASPAPAPAPAPASATRSEPRRESPRREPSRRESPRRESSHREPRREPSRRDSSRRERPAGAERPGTAPGRWPDPPPHRPLS